MRRGRGGRRAQPWAMAMALAAAMANGRVTADERPSNVRLRHPAQRWAMAQALQGAAHRLQRPECEGLLDEFTDTNNRSLRAALDEEGLTAEAFLARLFFYDAAGVACESSVLAGMDAPGSRVIRVCGRRLQRAMTDSRDHAEAIVIHEMLHALGLGENPPTSSYITTRVKERCRG